MTPSGCSVSPAGSASPPSVHVISDAAGALLSSSGTQRTGWPTVAAMRCGRRTLTPGCAREPERERGVGPPPLEPAEATEFLDAERTKALGSTAELFEGVRECPNARGALASRAA